MKQTVAIYLSHLYELGVENLDDINECQLLDLTSLVIQETPTKYLPKFEDKDHSRHIMTMMAKWMQTEDMELGEEILSDIKNLIIRSMEPLVNEAMEDYARREAVARREENRNREAEERSFDRNRI